MASSNIQGVLMKQDFIETSCFLFFHGEEISMDFFRENILITH